MAVRLVSDRVTIRHGGEADLDALLTIREEPSVQQWWRDADPDDVADDLDGTHGDHLLVIEVGGEVVGGIQYSEEPEPDYHHAEIDLFLSTAAQGQGIGAESVRLLAGYLIAQRGHHRLVIDPAADNKAAIRCYEKVGFRPVGIMRQYEQGADGSFHDGLLMDLLAEELILE